VVIIECGPEYCNVMRVIICQRMGPLSSLNLLLHTQPFGARQLHRPERYEIAKTTFEKSLYRRTSCSRVLVLVVVLTHQ